MCCFPNSLALLAELPDPLDLKGLRRLPGDAPGARIELERSLAKARSAHDALSEAYALVGIALLEEKAHRPGNADSLVREAARIARDPSFLGKVSMWIAHELSPLGAAPDTARSIAWLQAAVGEFRALGDRKELARALRATAIQMNQGIARRHTLEEAFTAAKDGGDVRDIAVIEGDFGEALRLTGDLAGAIQHLQASIARLESLEAWADTARALALLGRAYGAHGHFQQAEAALAKGESLYEKAGDVDGMMQIRGQRGILLAVAGHRKSAVEILDRVRAYASGNQSAAGLRPKMAGLAFAYLAAEEYAKAVEVAEEISRGIPRMAPAVVHWVLSSAYFHLGRYQDAVTAATTAIGRADDSVFNQREARRWRSLSLEKLGKIQDASLDMLEAIRLDDTVRRQLLSDDEWRRAFEESRAPLAQDAVALLWRAGQQREALNAAEQFRARAFLDLMVSRDNGAQAIVVASAALSAPATVNELSSYAVRSGVPILSYWVHPEAVYGWLIDSKGEVRGFRSPIPAARLGQLVKRARSLSYTPDRAAWRDLYGLLIQPVRHLLPPPAGQTLAVAPHGALLKLPFNALMNSSGRYLAEDYVLRAAPSAALLMRPASANRPAGRLLLVGDPVNASNSETGKSLPELPGARRELETIASLAPGNHTLLSAGLALKSRFRQEVPHARVVHFATHAVIDAVQPFHSFLALSNGDKLTAGEVHDLILRSDLVILSACRGGSGSVSSDGLLGLTRAFLYAGAARVIAPAWDVPDAPTVLLVEEFYRRFLAGASPGRALRAAQLKLLADLRFGRVVVQTLAGPMTLPEHPALWAGFLLQGAE